MDETDGAIAPSLSLSLHQNMEEDHLTAQNNNIYCQSTCMITSSSSKKRKVDSSLYLPTHSAGIQSSAHTCKEYLLHLKKSENIYMTEDWKGPKTSIFVPVAQDLFINISRYEQLSISEGTFFIGDDQGNYCGSVKGKSLHLWKYDKSSRHLFIVQSFLFTSLQDFMLVQQHLMS